MKFKSDRQRKKVNAIYNIYGVTTKPFEKYDKLPKDVTKKGNFEEQISVVTDKGIKKRAPNHRNAALKANLRDTLREPMEPHISVLKTAIKFAVPIAPIISEIIGLEDSALITKEVLNSFENSIEVYDKTKNIDEAIISGVKSFVINYAKDKIDSYMENVVSTNNKGSDNEFKMAVKGSILMTSLYSIMENVEGMFSNDNL
jgi:hypothetical protein